MVVVVVVSECVLNRMYVHLCKCLIVHRATQPLRLIELITCVMSSYPPSSPNVTENPSKTESTTCTTGSSNPVPALQLRRPQSSALTTPGNCHGHNRQVSNLVQELHQWKHAGPGHFHIPARSVALAYHDLFPSRRQS